MKKFILRNKKNESSIVRNENNVIFVNNVSKRFVLPQTKKTTIFESLVSIFNRNKDDYVYVLRDINLTINKGEFVGLIGLNGSGKSTLLRIIAGIIEPTAGELFSKGKIVSFIDLGVGFQNELTAKENIYLYSAIMGMSKNELKKKYPLIADFAGTKKFMDTKLKFFSSGMFVRLAFSTAIQTNPDILLLDEVLAVGDVDFQEKCFVEFEKFKSSGITLIFASHDLNLVERFCDKTVYLKNGKIVMQGETKKVIKTYLNETRSK